VTRLEVSAQGYYAQAGQQLRAARGALAVQIRSFEQSVELHTKSQHVLAPADGVVSNIAVSGPGELLAAGQPLLEIIPDGGDLIAQIKVANRDIAQLHVGMPVELRIDAMPYQDYGTLPGHIIEIPADATVEKAVEGTTTSYFVKVALDQLSLAAGGPPRPIILGMTLAAEIQVQRKTLLQLGIRWLFDLKDKI
jgi:HlyD family secretion protein